MQLFISDYTHNNKELTIIDQDIIHQLKSVLRYRTGDIFYIQKPLYLIDDIYNLDRYKIKITSFDKSKIACEILDIENIDISIDNKTMIVSMPNKWEKLEMICQKLAEIGIQNIIVFFSKRSVIKQPNDNKISRIQKIIKESIEQSYGMILPKLSFTTEVTLDDNTIVLYQGGDKFDLNINKKLDHTKYNTLVVGPEWGRDEAELDLFTNSNCKLLNIGSQILRTETACIIWAWFLKQL